MTGVVISKALEVTFGKLLGFPRESLQRALLGKLELHVWIHLFRRKGRLEATRSRGLEVLERASVLGLMVNPGTSQELLPSCRDPSSGDIWLEENLHAQQQDLRDDNPRIPPRDGSRMRPSPPCPTQSFRDTLVSSGNRGETWRLDAGRTAGIVLCWAGALA